jgi:autotransporter-associated beta strand protein
MKTTTSNPTAKNPFRAGSFSYAALITLTAFAIAGTAQTSADTHTWTGGIDGDWNDAGNWDNGIPVNFDNLIFSGTSNTATNNDIGGSFSNIQFSNTTAGQSFSLGGNDMNLYGTVSTADVVGGGTIEDTISLRLRTTAGTRTFNLGTDHNLTINGQIFGPQGIIKSGDGKLTLSAANIYGGSTTVNGGTLAIAVGGTISESNAIVINDTGTLRFGRNDTWGNATTDTSSSITVNAGGTMESGGKFNTIRDLNLNGGTVAMTGGVNATYPALALKGTVTVGGSQASQINTNSGTFNRISIGDGNLGATVFDVADSTSDASADLTVSTVLQNNGPVGGNSLTKTGAGTMELTATNTYTGSTTVSAGTLSLASSYTHSGSGAYIVNGGTLKIADGVNLGSHAMTISLGGVISPGNSPGTATVGTQNWGDGGSYLWEINNSGGFKGSDPGWDWLSITGDLNLGSLSASQFTIDITSLDLSNNSGLAAGFDYTGLAYGDLFDSFTIATTSGDINDFSSSLFSLNDSAFVNSKWDWQIRQDGKDLVLDAIFVPEPSSTALLGLGLSSLLLRRKRS